MKGVKSITDPTEIDSLLDFARYEGEFDTKLSSHLETILDVPEGFSRWEIDAKEREFGRKAIYFTLGADGRYYAALFVTFIERDGQFRYEFDMTGTHGNDDEPYEHQTGAGNLSDLGMWLEKTVHAAKRSKARAEAGAI